MHLGGLFLAKFLSKPTVYLSTPTWANHHQVFANVELPVEWYPYYFPHTKMLDFENMLATLRRAPPGSIILLHACAHNPTGIDPTTDQWMSIARVMQEHGLIPFLDCAYQGFASGSFSRDNWAIRYFIDQGFDMLIAQSFSKNLGLYGQRVGCLHIVVGGAGVGAGAPTWTTIDADADAHAHIDAVKRITSQLSVLQRSEISNPPIYGAQLASIVLNSSTLFDEWQQDLRTMADRLARMRQALKDELDSLQTPGQWDCLVKQIGMFAYTGLSDTQVQELRRKWHVYMTEDGRISVAGLNTRNVKYCAQAIDDVVRRTQ